ncbi:Pkinase domain-containing protein [Cephalotus follicularis]|uniref:Pkinase domain-containing protein n=1 Tax=Cephalotus follicularis TaxID=3775 RepID=A0A1Q3ANC7_CEPFO|nr:Pkinase domain-containing protein [Cephalotus follicularis]
MVYEYMQCNLLQLIQSWKHYFWEVGIVNWWFQILQGLAYMDKQGYFHCNIKPANLLLFNNNIVVKVADFRFLKETNSNPPYSPNVGTLWYKAPELLLELQVYDSKVDMWAVGVTMAELFALRPLFPCTDSADQLYRICQAIGCPSEDTWADGLELARNNNYQLPQLPGVPLSMLIPAASDDAISFISLLCSWDPCKRPTAAQALQHRFFKRCFYIPRHPCLTPTAAPIRRPVVAPVGHPCLTPVVAPIHPCLKPAVAHLGHPCVIPSAVAPIRHPCLRPTIGPIQPRKRINGTNSGTVDATEKLENLKINAPASQCSGQQMQTRAQKDFESTNMYTKPIFNLIQFLPVPEKKVGATSFPPSKGSAPYVWNVF